MKQIDYSPKNDFYVETGRFSSYFFHYTNVESVFKSYKPKNSKRSVENDDNLESISKKKYMNL